MKNEMLTYNEYVLIAEKIILNACMSKVSKIIMSNNDMFGSVVTAVMTADWKYNGKGTIYGYRKQRALWAIYKILADIRLQYKHKVRNFSQILQCEEDNFEDLCVQYQNDLLKDVDDQDYLENIQQKIESSDILTNNEKTVLLGKIIENKSVKQIAEDFGICNESVRQTLKRASVKIGNSLCF